MSKRMMISDSAKTKLMIVTFIIMLLLGVFACNSFVSAEGEDTDDYIEIRTAKDLYKIRSNMEGKYKLMNDIDLTEATSPGGDYDFNGCGWNPIGSNNTYSNTAFTGVFDGQGYTIRGLNFNLDKCYENNNIYIGLFSNNEGVIKNLKISDGYLLYNGSSPNIYYGTVAAQNSGEISNIIINHYVCNVDLYFNNGAVLSDSVTAADAYIGGIVGENKSLISGSVADIDFNCAATGHRSYVNYVILYYSTIKLSGIACNNSSNAVISQCSSGGSFKETLNSYAAVIDSAGISWTSEQYTAGTVTDSYSEMAVSDYGVANKGTIRESYYTGEGKPQTEGTATNCYYLSGKGTAGTGWTGLNESQMQDSDFFEGFDFENTWRMSEDTVYKYPQLQSIKNGVTSVEIISEPTNEIVVGTELKYEGAVARINREDGSYEDVELTPENTTGGDTSTTGNKTVTYTYKGISASFEIEVVPVKIIDLEVKQLPNKTEYIEGQAFDPKGLVVYSKKNNGQEAVLNDYSLSDVDTTPGEKTVTISYGTIEKQFTVTYIEKIATKIEVTSAPSKTVYDEGEAFDPTGMVVKATYNDGDIKEISDYEVGDISGYGDVAVEISYAGLKTSTTVKVRKIVKSINFDKDKAEIYEKEKISLTVEFVPSDAENKELVWSSSDETVATVNENGEIEGAGEGTAIIKAFIKGYEDVFATCEVSVKAIQVTDIEITQQPNKTCYKKGEVFDPAGMVVSFVYNNGAKSECDDYTIGEMIGVGDVNVAITWGDYSKSVQVSVITITDIEITHKPTKTRYKEEEAFDPTGMVVSYVYDNGTKSECNDYTISDISGVGDVDVTITWGDFSKTVQVSVVTIADIEIASKPNKTNYKEGESFDPTGLIVKAVFSDGEKETCTDYVLGEMEGTGDVKVSVTYAGFEKYIDVHVSSVESLSWMTKDELDEIDKLKELTANGAISGVYKQSSLEDEYTVLFNDNKVSFTIYNQESGYKLFGSYSILDSSNMSLTMRIYWPTSGDEYSNMVTTTDVATHVVDYDNSKLVYTYSGGKGMADSMFKNDTEAKINSAKTSAQLTEFYLLELRDILATYNVDLSKCGFRKMSSGVIPDNPSGGDEPGEGVIDAEIGGTYNISWTSSTERLFKVNITKRGILKVDATKPKLQGSSTYEWIFFRIYDKNGAQIWANRDAVDTCTDNSIKSYSNQIGLSEGEYYIGVRPYGVNYSGKKLSTTVGISFSEYQYTEIEPNDTNQNATQMLLGNEYKGYIGQGEDDVEKNDYWYISLKKGEKYRFSVVNGSFISSTTAIMELISPSGDIYSITSYMRPRNGNYAEFNTTEEGKYYVRVYNYSGVQKEYKIKIEQLSNNSEESGDSNQPVTYGKKYKASFASKYSAIKYKVNVPEQGVLTIDATKPSNKYGIVRLYFSIFDENDNLIWNNKTFNASRNASGNYINNIGLPKGNYSISISPDPYVVNYGFSSDIAFGFNSNANCEIEPNNDIEHAQMIKLDTNYMGYYGNDGGETESAEYWQVNFDNGHDYKILFGANKNIDNDSTLINMYSPAGDKYGLKFKLRDSILMENGMKYVVYSAKETGTYTIEFKNYSLEQYEYNIQIVDVTKADEKPDEKPVDKEKYSNEWVNGKWYDADGKQTYAGTLQWKSNATGWWVEDTSGWYPADQWQKIDGIWYYFKPDGYMAANEYYKGYWFNSDGSWDDKYLLSWRSNSTGWWVEDISGWWPASSWLKIDGYWYYFDASGYMVTSQYVDGWWISADGVCY